jgi:hypothetical protein
MKGPALEFLHITRGPGPTDPVNAEYRIVFAPRSLNPSPDFVAHSLLQPRAHAALWELLFLE